MTGGVCSDNFIFRGSVYTPEMPKKLPLEYKSRQKYADNPRDTGSWEKITRFHWLWILDSGCDSWYHDFRIIVYSLMRTLVQQLLMYSLSVLVGNNRWRYKSLYSWHWKHYCPIYINFFPEKRWYKLFILNKLSRKS